MKRISEIEIKNKTLLILLIVAAIMLLLPVLIIAKYNHPCADDFTYGYYTHAFWSTTGSISETFKWAFHTVKSTYDTWQGTFSSAFFMSLSPVVFGEDLYWITSFIMLGIWGIAVYYLFYVLLIHIFNVNKVYWGILSTVVYLFSIQQMYSPVNGIFWYNASIHYTFMQSILLIMLSHVVRLLQVEMKWRKILFMIFSILGAIIASGANYITVLNGCIFISLIFLYALIKKKKRVLYVIPSFLIFYIGAYFNITAYGNQIRSANFEGFSSVETIKLSLISGSNKGLEFFSVYLLIAMFFLFPTIWNMLEGTKFEFRLPGIFTFLSYCIFSTMFSPAYYGMGSEGVDRTINVIKMMYHILVFLNYIYWIGYARRKLREKELKFIMPQYLLFYIVCGVILMFFFMTSPTKETDSMSYAAYLSIKSGEAEGYDKQYDARLKLLESDEKNIELNEFMFQPRLLYYDDITTDIYDWKNSAVKNWYGKESVKIRTY